MSQICECWGLTRKKVEEAVRTRHLRTPDEIYDHFQGVGCGVCIEDMEAIIASCEETTKG
ncbi:(2Fe-2S)-binding protein [Rhodospirillum sp. A1_3_36]|uniref:(2Fe-2S)-binding protein n=1 Tax=Rhodospirillum sp. A1_3_36 TaxID=3391666 RepID=UPI0039A61183